MIPLGLRAHANRNTVYVKCVRKSHPIDWPGPCFMVLLLSYCPAPPRAFRAWYSFIESIASWSFCCLARRL